MLAITLNLNMGALNTLFDIALNLPLKRIGTPDDVASAIEACATRLRVFIIIQVKFS